MDNEHPINPETVENLFSIHASELFEMNEHLQAGLDYQKRVEEALKFSEERFAAVFHMSPIAMAIATAEEGRYADVNETFLTGLGYAREEIVGHTSEELEIWSKSEDRLRFIRMLSTNGFVRGELFPMRAKTGEIKQVLLSATPITLHNGLFILSTSYDITEQRKLEEQLRHSQKMEAIGTLAGGIAHDFNNILGGIIGYSELITSHHIGKDHPAYPYLEGIIRSSLRAKDLVAQMLAFSRHHEQMRMPVKIESIIKEAMKLLRASLPSSITINTHIVPMEGSILADPTQVHQLLMNLVTNAAHAMEGTNGILNVSLRTALFGLEDALPHPDLCRDKPYQELCVSDSGHGIDPAIISRIFDPFFTTKKPEEGTGLGLSVVYGIVKSYGGVIDVESTVGKGTAFRIYIPMTAAAAAQEQTGVESSVPGGRERIMLVDDELNLTEVFKVLLTDLGYTVSVFNDPALALKDFREHSGDYDLVITDMTMPHMSGTKFAAELSKLRSIPIILCTGRIDRMEHKKDDRSGIRKTLKKPITINQLAIAVRQLLDTP